MTGSRCHGLIVSALAVVLALPATAESLRDALTAAYNNSNLLEQNRALLRATDEDVATALSALRPQVAGRSTITQSDQASGPEGGSLSSTISLSLDLLLYDSGSTALGVAAAKQTVNAARQQLVSLEQQVLFSAVQAYLGVLSNSRVVSLRQSNLRLITQELRAARDRFEVGEVTRTDVAQAEARLAQARGDLAQAQGDLEISRELYLVTVGRRPGALSGIGGLPGLPSSVDAARRLGERQSPLVRQLQFEIAANELNVQRAKANTKPRINLNASVGHGSSNDNNSTIRLEMNVPIYQGGQLSALTRRAIAVVHASRSELNQQVIEVRQDVSDSWSQLAVAQAQLASTERQIRAAEVAFNGVREEAKLGARTTLDVLDAEQSLLDARTTRVTVETQVFAAAFQLLSAMGALTTEALNLPVERYDPDEYFNVVKTAPVPSSKQGQKLNRILQRYQKN